MLKPPNYFCSRVIEPARLVLRKMDCLDEGAGKPLDDGRMITLLDKKGLKVDCVAYTGERAEKEGGTPVF